VLTNQLELVGWGKAPLEWHTRSVVGAIEDVSQLAVGADPARIEHHWRDNGIALHVAHLCAQKNRDMIGSVQLCDGGISLVTAVEINDQK